MFCDLVGSTELSSRLDPEDLSSLIQMYQGRVAETIGRFNGYIARYVGDGILTYFGWPKADETDAERAVRAALGVKEAISATSVQGETLRVRIGIATGLVVVGSRIGTGEARAQVAIGSTPNRAARLQGLIGPGGIVIDGATRELVGDLFHTRALGAIPLKGLPEPVDVFEVYDERIGQSRFEALRSAQRFPLVGREEELEVLLRHWIQARQGEGKVVLISGEAGIGKSRLLTEFDEKLAGQTFTPLRYFCSPHNAHTPLFPILRQLEVAAGFTHDDLPAVRAAKLRTLLERAGATAEDVALVTALLHLPDDGLPSLVLTPQRRKERTYAALLRQIECLSAQRPLLMLFEDVHWADPSTRDILDELIQHLEKLPVLLAMTFRPEFRASWVGRAGVTLVTLDRLERGEAAMLALQVATRLLLPEMLLDRIVAQSDGIPLFIEELTKAVLEAAPKVASAAPAVAVPATLQASLLARLDRIPEGRQVAQIGSVIGRDFSRKLLAAVADLPDSMLDEGLHALVVAGLLFHRGEGADAIYIFKHALVQDAAYENLLRAKRTVLHRAIAKELIAGAESAAVRPEVIGHHCEHADLLEDAIQYYLQGAERAAAQSGLTEAGALLDRARRLLGHLPDDSTRYQLSLRVESARGPVLIAVKGFAALELEEALSDARSYWDRLGKPMEFLQVPWGQFLVYVNRSETHQATWQAEDLLTLGHARNEPTGLILGNLAKGTVHMMRGELTQSTRSLEEVVRLCDPSIPPRLLLQAGIHPDCMGRTFLGNVLLWQGFPEKAVVESMEAIARARRLNHAPTLGQAFAMMAKMAAALNDDGLLSTCAKELEALAQEHGFPYWSAQVPIYEGRLRMGNDDPAPLVKLMRDGLDAYRASGAHSWVSQYTIMLSEVMERAGQVDGALDLLDIELKEAEKGGERFCAADICRRQGELLLKSPTLDSVAAEIKFRQGIEIARRQSARFWELRCATSFARLCCDRGRHSEAGELLAPLYSWFSEGFDTSDLTAARLLLEEIELAGRGITRARRARAFRIESGNRMHPNQSRRC
jgi:class 3 adenylate cyclase/predicted ATPase